MSELPNSATVLREQERYFQVVDPLLGEYPLDKQSRDVSGVLADILQTPIAQRAFDLTQLSKAGPHTTIPGTEQFHRLGHVLGVAEFTSRLAHRENIDAERHLAYVLHASLSDLAHGPFSHATDIAVQGPGSNETFHESRLPEALALGGVQLVLAQHRIASNAKGELDGYSIPPWVESSAPDICVDRLQYTLHELLLWFESSESSEAARIRQTLEHIATLETIQITDGNMAFTDLDEARLFAKGYLLLSTEHWNDPVNRVQLYLIIESLKYAILSRRLPGMQAMDNGVTRKPFDYLYAVDGDVLAAMQCEPGHTDPYLFVIENQLADIGHEEQNRFTQFRRRVYEQFLDDPLALEYPSSILHPNLADFGPASSRFEIELLDKKVMPPQTGHPQVPRLMGENGDLQYGLYPLKNRYIDPLVQSQDDKVNRLSELDPGFAALLEQHQIIQRSSLRVHIPTTRAYKDLLWQQAQEISQAFFDAQETNDPLNNDPKRRGIEAAGTRAVQAAAARGVYLDKR